MSRKNSRNTIRLPKPSGKLHLSKYGYHVLDTELTRQKALRKAIKRNNKISNSKTLEVLRHLVLISNLQNKTTNMHVKNRIRKDIKYLQKIYHKKK